MLKNHDFGLHSSVVRAFLAFLWASVPLNAAAMDRDGDLMPKEGGAKRCLPRRLFRLDLVGDLPAAAGAVNGVVDLAVVSVRGVNVVASDRRGLVGIVLRLYRAGLDTETSSLRSARLRLMKDLRVNGSTFSESDASGEACRRLRDGAGEEASRVFWQFFTLCRLRR